MRISDWSSDVCSSDLAGRSSKVQFRFRELGGNFGKGFRLPMAIEIFMGDIIAIELTDRLHHLTDGRILSKIACIGVNEPLSESERFRNARQQTTRRDRKSTRLNSSH